MPSLVSGFSRFYIVFPAVLIVLADRCTPRRYLKLTRFRFATRLSPLAPRFPLLTVPNSLRVPVFRTAASHFRSLSSSELTAGLHQPSSFHFTVPPLTMSGVSHVCPGTKKTRNKQHWDGGCDPCRIEVAWRRSFGEEGVGNLGYT